MTGQSGSAVPRLRRDGRFLLLPAATFLVGLLLGAVLMWVGTGTGGSDAAGAGDAPATVAPPPATPTSDEPDIATVAPPPCREAAQRAREMTDLARRAAAAIGEFDAQRLQELVDEMEDLDPQIRSAAADCEADVTS